MWLVMNKSHLFGRISMNIPISRKNIFSSVVILFVTLFSSVSVAGEWRYGPELPGERHSHTATRLSTGEVVVIGGEETGAVYLDSAIVFDPSGSTYVTATGRLHESRSDHTATRLRDGRVLVVGGTASGGLILDTAEIFDPATGMFAEVGDRLNVGRRSHTATRLPDGTVLITGGTGSVDGDRSRLDSAEIFDPASESFRLLASRMSSARSFHTATPLRIRSGLYRGAVLIVGGTVAFPAELESDIYVPRRGGFEPGGSLVEARRMHTATRIPPPPDDNPGRLPINVLIAGGSSATNQAEIYDFWTRTFSLTDATTFNHKDHTATFLPGRKKTKTPPSVLIAGGRHYLGLVPDGSGGEVGAVGSLDASEEYSAWHHEWGYPGVLGTSRVYHTATRLTSGEVLVVGGYHSDGSDPEVITTALNSTEIYTP